MLPLPPFTLHEPRTLGEAIDLLARFGEDARVFSGGTDLLPNMKRGLDSPRHLVALRRVGELDGVRRDGDLLRIGAMTTLDAIARHSAVRENATALAEAAHSVGGPHHRRMGTLGGNLCLDTRCRYYDQSYFWRQALGFCIKKDGTKCHVVEGGRNCVAAACNDGAAAIVALDAVIELSGPAGARTVPARDFYTSDGTWNTVRQKEEIVVAVRVPIRAGRTSAYEKLRRRGAIDFPLLGVAAVADRDEGGKVTGVEVVVSALAARPRRIQTKSLAANVIAQAAYEACHPLANVDGDAEWRREMVPVLVRRALARVGA
jgi:4-hydroxybenzoyl-CoA reductase subunit beta